MANRPRVDPVVWQPPPYPDRARQPSGAQPFPPLALLPLGAHGPEDVVVDAEGRLITGVEDGRILRVRPDSGEIEVLADTGGRPLGLEMLPDGDVLICDSHRGLLRLGVGTGDLELLVAGIDRTPLRFCSNVVAAPDGTLYFTDSTMRFRFEYWRAAILEARATGRLFRRAPDGQVEVLLEGLHFANGVVLAPDGQSLVVAETGGYRLTRYWLAGPRAGTTEPLIDNLPGFPDNLSLSDDGQIWVAIVTPRDRTVDWLHRAHPLRRKVVWALPQRLQPDPVETAWVMKIGFDGRIAADLQASGIGYRSVTGQAEHDGKLYLGSIAESSLAVLDLAAVRV